MAKQRSPEQLAKIISYILGRNPAEFGLVPDSDGVITSYSIHYTKLYDDSMGNSISGMSLIADSMTEMDQYVSAMRGSVDGMNTSMTAIDNYMSWINGNMNEMTGRMAGMSP